ncbi:MAG TPA: hypothetical protein VNC60_07820 [Actinomycetota bacterium]|nr:hypothetical protein [Actinomycetota bacterium]
MKKMTMTKMKRSSAAVLPLVIVFTIVGAVGASAEERTCRGSIGRRTVDNLRVPDGATCRLNGTTVKGTIKVEGRATLVATDVRVIGNVQAENARRVVVREGSHVGGSVQIVHGRSGRVAGSNVQGDILFDDNTAKVAALGSTVGGNIQAFQNTGGVRIGRNRVDGNLQCKENRPTPVGGNNVVQGNKEDQCARL